MNKVIKLDAEDVFYLLNLLPAMKDIADPQRYMKIISEVHLQIKGEMAVSVEPPVIKMMSDPIGKTFTNMLKGVKKMPLVPHNYGTEGEPLVTLDSLSDMGVTHLPPPDALGWSDGVYNYFKLPQDDNYPDKVKCIKFIREVMGFGLKEAKDAFEANMNFHLPSKWSPAMLQKKATEAGLKITFS